jgi:tetratricopeptide (TPR) repeat protein
LDGRFLRLYLNLDTLLQARPLSLLVAALLLLMTLWSGCSVEQNTISASIFHNMTAHYNGFYYAREESRQVEKTILKSLDDDHNQILWLFPKLDTTLAKTYAKDTEDIIKMASISIQRHPNSQWVDDNYVQVGLARLYACDFVNAIQTFKYVNTKSKDPNLRHIALINLMRTFIAQEDFDHAEEVFHFLEKEKLERTNQKNLYLWKAYFYQLKKDYDNMVRNLTKADSLLKRSDRKGRIYFIIGQVYQKIGFESEAYNYYKKCLATNPDYEIDFYARLNMAQVARLDSKKDIRTIRKQFQKLLTDSKNQEFKDKIFYEMGEFERKQGNLNEAIGDYKLSAHAGKNKRIRGGAYLRLGQVYYDSLKKYSLAKAYYDSAVSSLPKDVEDYVMIKKRQEVLGDFVKYNETIHWQDSLLLMASLDSTVLRKQLDSTLSLKKKNISGKRKRKRSDGSGPTGGDQSTNAFFNSSGGNGGNNSGDNGSGSDQDVAWYFANSSAVSLGESEFQRVWGSIGLEDNWRRSGRSISAQLPDQKAASANAPSAPKPTEVSPEKKQSDEIDKLIAQLPRTDEQKKAALDKIADAYFKLGDIYYFQLGEKDNAAGAYQKLLDRFPGSEHEPEVLYKMYLISREKNEGTEKYVNILKEKYPNSTYTKILLNPDYLKESSLAAEKQKLIYKDAYASYAAGNLRTAQEKVNQGLKEGDTGFSPQLELLQILITGKTEDITRYQFELEQFIKKYPDISLKPYAERLLAASKALQEKIEKAKGIRFIKAFKEPHFFVIVYKLDDKITDQVSDGLEAFNTSGFKEMKLNTSNLVLNEEFALTMVSELTDRNAAMKYYEDFTAQALLSKPFALYKFYTFVITKDNFDIFYRTKALDEYLTFFDRNYQPKNP